MNGVLRWMRRALNLGRKRRLRRGLIEEKAQAVHGRRGMEGLHARGPKALNDTFLPPWRPLPTRCCRPTRLTGNVQAPRQTALVQALPKRRLSAEARDHDPFTFA